MKISIITVCYNSEKTIQKTFASVRNQTYNDIEYIVVDGNSSDGTLQMIRDNDDIISRWISESDQGLYDAMNKGIRMATGEVVGILNSDDFFYDENVLKQIAIFHKVNLIDASIGNIVQSKSNGKLVRFYSAKYWKPEKLKSGFMPPHPSIFFKRELFDEYGNYNLSFLIGGDYELITRFFLKNEINWKYSGITTTRMLVGGISSSGTTSYKLITKEIMKALSMNGIEFLPFIIEMRFFCKIMEFLKK